MFDEADLDAALARFDELSRPAPRLENAASRVLERFCAHFAARDWDAMAEILADDFMHRRSSSRGERWHPTRSGCRDRELAVHRRRRVRGTSTSTIIATRGERLVLSRARYSRQRQAETFHIEVLDVVEIDADNRIAAHVTFDLDDIDAAFEELDARYLAGEAAAHAHTWSVIAATCRGLQPSTSSPRRRPAW